MGSTYKSKLKVLQIGKYYHPRVGGIERHVQELSEGLTRAGHSVKCLVSNNNPQRSSEIVNQVEVFRASNFGKLFSNPLTLWPQKPFENWQPDIVHIHLPHPLPAWFYKKIGCPTVVTYHGDVNKGFLLQPVYEKVLKNYLQRVSAIIVSSEQLLNFSQLQNAGVREKINIIPIGINDKRLVSAQLLESENIVNWYPPILFVGRLVKYKGLEYLIRAMKNVDAQVGILGYGPDEKYLKSLVKKLKLNKKVWFLGFQPDKVLIEMYRNCKMVVLPSISKSESFGISLVEALACGKPIISTRLPTGILDVNIDGETGLSVPIKDSGALTNAINKLLHNKKLRLQLGLKARAHYENCFTQQKMTLKHEGLYTKVLDNIF